MIDRPHRTRYYFGSIAEVIDLDSQDALVSIARDLSWSGCFVKTPTPFPKGKEVRVRIRHSGEDFAAIGKVTENILGEGIGIEFVEVTPHDRAILECWLGLKRIETRSSDDSALSEPSRSEHPTGSVPVIVSGQSARGFFTEETEVQVIIPNGAVLNLAAEVSPGQVVQLKNRLTQVDKNCRVLFVEPMRTGKSKLLAVAFIQPSQDFWGNS